MSVTQPYQSKLFNLINRQSRKFGDRWAQKLRQTKVATVWGLQAVLYPVYLFWQTTRLGVKQVKQQVKRSRHQFQPAVDAGSDFPVLQTLQTIAVFCEAPNSALKPEPKQLVDNLRANLTVDISPLEIPPSKLPRWLQRFIPGRLVTRAADQDQAPVSAAPNRQRLALQGIATLLTNRNLVLVAPDNQVLDILTPKQQQQLQQQLIWVMAEYAHKWRRVRLLNQGQLQLGDRSQPRSLPPIQDQPILLPPIRLLQQLMAWVQTSPVAIAANVFQESTLPASSIATSEPSPSLVPGISWFRRSFAQPLISPQALASADQAIATLERDPFGSMVHATTTLKLHTQHLWQWVQSQLSSQGLLQYSTTPKFEVNQTQDAATVTLSEVKRQNWLSRAVAYLNAPRSLVRKSTSKLTTDAKNARVISATPISGESRFDATSPVQTVARSNTWLTWGQRLSQIGGKLAQTKTTAGTPIMPSRATSAQVVVTDRSPTQPLRDQVHDIEVDPVFMGYEKHPLAQILEWLDRAVAWLEALLTRLLQRWLPSLKHQYSRFFYPRSPQD